MKKSKWNGQACPVCAAGVLHDGSKTVTKEYKGHPYQTQVRGAFCDKCDEAVLAYNATEEAAWLAFRNQVDQQVASELESIRKRLKLTQAQAAKLTGGGKNAFSRYERGQAKPVAAVINLFKIGCEPLTSIAE